MKVWELAAIKGSRHFRPWYDKAFLMIVIAETEERARELASENAAEESKKPWLTSKHTTCREVDLDKEVLLSREVSWS